LRGDESAVQGQVKAHVTISRQRSGVLGHRHHPPPLLSRLLQCRLLALGSSSLRFCPTRQSGLWDREHAAMQAGGAASRLGCAQPADHCLPASVEEKNMEDRKRTSAPTEHRRSIAFTAVIHLCKFGRYTFKRSEKDSK
jgi:hypothetical protein